jgi:hypothetical protein
LIFAFVNAGLKISSCVDFKDQRSKFKDQISFGSGDLAVVRASVIAGAAKQAKARATELS